MSQMAAISPRQAVIEASETDQAKAVYLALKDCVAAATGT